MSEDYLLLGELAAMTGLSPATLWRLKKAGKIPFFQPGGPGHSVRFPPDAIEQAMKQSPPEKKPEGPKRLSGRRPAWMQAISPPTATTAETNAKKA